MNFNKDLWLLFVLFIINFHSIESLIFDRKPNYFICGVNNSDFIFNPKVGPTVRLTSTAIIEIGLFYDQSFYDKFSDNLQDFVKSLLRQVQIIFEYPSMNPQIRLVVTRLIQIESHEVPKQRSIDKYSRDLCEFQFNKYWKYDKDYDLALFLSGSRFYSKIIFSYAWWSYNFSQLLNILKIQTQFWKLKI